LWPKIALGESAQAMKSAAVAEAAEQRVAGEFRLRPRRAGGGDVEELARLERSCFEPWRQDSRDVIRRSVASARQEVWVVPADAAGGRLTGALFLRFPVPGRMRVYSVAVDASCRGEGLGQRLMAWAEERARAREIRRLTLEADAANPGLLAWYERLGFRKTAFLADFYDPGRGAWRMERDLEPGRGLARTEAGAH
jgi:ribosomal protein S18 acetylase RimI-like enzyme